MRGKATQLAVHLIEVFATCPYAKPLTDLSGSLCDARSRFRRFLSPFFATLHRLACGNPSAYKDTVRMKGQI